MRAEKALRAFGWVAAGLYLVAGVAELIYAGDSVAHRPFFLAAMTALAVLVVVGIRLLDTRPWVGAGAAAVGAVLGRFSLLWRVLATVLAIEIAALSVICARRVSVAPA